MGNDMQGLNKFRIITAAFILMFIFAIAAMYTNTKDITAQRIKNSANSGMSTTAPAGNNNSLNNNKLQFNEQMDNQSFTQLQNLNGRIEQLERSVRNLNGEVAQLTESGLACKIRGILDNGEVISLPPAESIAEAKMNKREIVITCVNY